MSEIEKIKNNENCHIKLLANSDEQRIHWHEELIEIVFIISGSANVKLIRDEYLLKEDDIIVLNRKIPHSIKKMDEKLVYISLFIDTCYFETYIPNISRVFFINHLSAFNKDDDAVIRSIKNNMARIYIELMDRNEEYEKRIISNCITTLTILINEFNYIKKSPDSFRTIEQFERFWMICRYMLNNHTKKISLSEMAGYVHVSESHLSHSIKEATDLNFEELLNLYRSEDAARLLLATNMSITKISYECGFSDQKYFNSFFKKFFGSSPNDYRNENQKYYSIDNYEEIGKSYIDQELLNSKISSYIQGKSQIKGSIQDREYNLNIDAEEMSYPFSHYWLDCVCIGEASNLLKSSYQTLIKNMQSDIGFKYFKFHSLFNSETVQMKGNDVNIDWNSLYSMIDFIYESEARPYINFGFEKYSLGTFKAIMSQFINNCIEKFGTEEFEKWKFSVTGVCPNENVFAKNIAYLNILNNLLDDYIPGHRADMDACEIYDSSHLLYDTAFMGPYFINKAIKGINVNSNINKYNTIFDSNNAELFHGGLGLATKGGLKKPLYHAYHLISMLGDRILSQGINYIITKRKDIIQVLVYHTPSNYDEQFLNNLQIESSDRYSLFMLEEDVTIDINITNLSGNAYIIKKYLMNRKYGSIYDHIPEAGSPFYITAKEKEYLNNICNPRLTFDFIKGQKSLNIRSKLEPNSAELYLIEKV